MAADPSLLRLLGGAALVLAAGAAVASTFVPTTGRSLARPAFLALAWVLGLSLLAPLLLLGGVAGLPVRPWSILALAVAVTAVAWLVQRTWPPTSASGTPAPPRLREAAPTQILRFAQDDSRHDGEPRTAVPRALAVASRVVLLAAFALFVWKVAVWPLWSWDHHAMWGMKARRMVVDGRLDLGFLATEEMVGSRPDRPLGFSAMPLLVTLGEVPGERTFKLFHLSLGLALLVLLREGLLRLRLSAAAAEALTAWSAALPLFWDTEAVGGAEMPFALWAMAAALLLFLPRAVSPEARRRALMAGGVVVGFLPWIKQEGLPLAVAFAMAVAALAPRRERLRELRHFLLPPLVLVSLNLWFYFTQLPPGVGFFSGDPLARLWERLPETASLLAYMGRGFLLPDALGFWLAFAAAGAFALWRRRWLAVALAGVVAIQVLIYVGTAFVVYLPPRAHVDAALTRIIAALMPLGMLAIGAAIAPKADALPDG